MKFVLVFALVLVTLVCHSAAVRPDHCLEPHPVGEGMCMKLMLGYWFNPATNQCEEWAEGGCHTVGGHSYSDFQSCVADCIDTA